MFNFLSSFFFEASPKWGKQLIPLLTKSTGPKSVNQKKSPVTGFIAAHLAINMERTDRPL